MNAFLLIAHLFASTPSAPAHTVDVVPVSRQTPAERRLTHSDAWDCYRAGRDRFTTCERDTAKGKQIVKLRRIVAVK